MRIGMIGLGRMGASMTLRLLRGGHEVVGYDVKGDAVERAAQEGAVAAASIEDVVGRLEPPRAVWIMVPAGEVTSRTIDMLATLMARETPSSMAGTPATQTRWRMPPRSRKRGSRSLMPGPRAASGGWSRATA